MSGCWKSRTGASTGGRTTFRNRYSLVTENDNATGKMAMSRKLDQSGSQAIAENGSQQTFATGGGHKAR